MLRDLIKLLNVTKHAEIQNLMLTQGQLKILEYLDTKETVTTQELAEWLGISIQSASGRLSKLFNKGYLKKQQKPDPTGGHYFIYSANNDFRKIDLVKLEELIK